MTGRTVEETRELLGIRFCPTCRVDTMPLDRTGRCGWCDQKLVAGPDDRPCKWCAGPIPEGSRPVRLYCSPLCSRRSRADYQRALMRRVRQVAR